MVDLTQSLGWIINQEKSKLKPQVFSFVGYKYHLDSSVVKPTQERRLKLGFDPMLKVKTCFDRFIFDVANWVAHLNRQDDPGGTPSHEALSVSPQGALEIASVIRQPPSLVRDHFNSPRVVAKFHKCDEGCRPPQRPQYPNLHKRLKQCLGYSLRASLFKRSVVRQGKKATHKCPRVEGDIYSPKQVQGPVSKSNSVGCYGQLDSNRLHKQMCSSVENHDLVRSLPDDSKSQAHSRVPECDG